MDMIRLLAKGVTDQEQLLNCARGKVKTKKEQLIKALDGTLQSYHHTQLQMLLEDYDHVQKQVDFLEKSITEIISEHYAQAFECLDSISGIGVKSAEIIISEAGKDMSRFPTADHLQLGAVLRRETMKVLVNGKTLRLKKVTVIYVLPLLARRGLLYA